MQNPGQQFVVDNVNVCACYNTLMTPTAVKNKIKNKINNAVTSLGCREDIFSEKEEDVFSLVPSLHYPKI